jgi:outer membrane protein insertion porin family
MPSLRHVACALAMVTIVVVTRAEAQPAPTIDGRPIDRVDVRGNHRVETDAVRVALQLHAGSTFERARLQSDIRALWQTSWFSDVQVETELAEDGGAVLTFVVVEKPAIRRILIDGNHDVELSKLNEVIDLQRDAVLDRAKVEQNRQKLADLYAEKGYYLAKVATRIDPAGDGEADVVFEIDERARIAVRKVEFVGNHDLSDDELRDVIGTRAAGGLSFLSDQGTFQQTELDRDLLLLTAHYWDRGYATVQIGEPSLRLSRDQKNMYITIPITEGPVYTIASVDFAGDLLGDEASHRAMTGQRVGAPFSRSQIAADRERLVAYYQDQGYAYADVSPMTKPDVEHRTIALTYQIERGARAYFERVEIHGNGKTRDKVIRRELEIAEGELFSRTRLEASKARVEALGFFESVNLSTRRGSADDMVIVDVQVAERQNDTIQAGAGFSSVDSFIAQGAVTMNNLLGRGQALTAQVQLSSHRHLFLLHLVEPYFLDSNWSAGIDLYNQSQVYTLPSGSFTRDATGGDLTWGYGLGAHARAFLTYKLEEVGIETTSGPVAKFGATDTTIEGGQVANLYRGGLTSSVRASITWDSLDDRFLPHRGWHDEAFVEWADRYTGSENEFVRWGGSVRNYHPLWGPFVLHTRAEVGFVTSRDPLGVPIAERYLMGGIDDVRGYAPRSLGPELSTGASPDGVQDAIPLGGNMQLLFSSELQFPLFKKIGLSGVLFFDMGNAYNLEPRYCTGSSSSATAFDPCFHGVSSIVDGMRRSVGFGFRWQSPIGPLRFEWGIPLDRTTRPDGSKEDSIVFGFSLGSSL